MKPRLSGWRAERSFTLIELMAASAVLSVVLLLMLGMQDQMSRAWGNASRRTETTREARTAIRLMASDLAALRYRNSNFSYFDASPSSVTGKPVPWVYFSGTGNSPLVIPNRLSNSSYIFGIAPRSPTAENEDLQLVGYYVALSSNTNISGFSVPSYNLHRYFRTASNTADLLDVWFQQSANPNPGVLFAGINPAQDEILAQNVANLSIHCFAANISNGPNYSFAEWYTTNYNGSKMQVSLTFYPENVAQTLRTNVWASASNISRHGRSYEFRLDWLRHQNAP